MRTTLGDESGNCGDQHRTRGGRIPAIALTAYATSADRDKCLNAGFQLHMAKPAESAMLIAAVAGLVAKSRPYSGGRSKT